MADSRKNGSPVFASTLRPGSENLGLHVTRSLPIVQMKYPSPTRAAAPSQARRIPACISMVWLILLGRKVDRKMKSSMILRAVEQTEMAKGTSGRSKDRVEADMAVLRAEKREEKAAIRT